LGESTTSLSLSQWSNSAPTSRALLESSHDSNMIEASRANAVRQTRSRATLETITRERALCERVLAYLTTANCWQTAEEIAAGATIKRKTIQNVLGGMVRETPPPLTTRGNGVKSAPRGGAETVPARCRMGRCWGE